MDFGIKQIESQCLNFTQDPTSQNLIQGGYVTLQCQVIALSDMFDTH